MAGQKKALSPCAGRPGRERAKRKKQSPSDMLPCGVVRSYMVHRLNTYLGGCHVLPR